MSHFEQSAARPTPEKESVASLEKLREVRVLRGDETIDDGWKVVGSPDMHKENAKVIVYKTEKDKNGKSVPKTKTINAIELYALNPEIRGVEGFRPSEFVQLWNTTEADPSLKIKLGDLKSYLGDQEQNRLWQFDEAKARLREIAGKIKKNQSGVVGEAVPLESYVAGLDRREKLFGLSPKEAQELRAMREAMRKTDREEKMAA